MKRILVAAAVGLAASPASAFVVPNLGFDNDRPIVVPLLEEGVVGVEFGIESGGFDCDCMPLAEEGGGGFVLGLSYDRAFHEHFSWRVAGRIGQKTLSYAVDGADAHIELLSARLQLGAALYLTPWDYMTLLIGVGGFASAILDVDGEVDGIRRAAYSRQSDYADGEAGLTGGLMLAFSPGRGRSWLWSVAIWVDYGLTHIGEPPGVTRPDRNEPLHTQSLSGTIGVHF